MRSRDEPPLPHRHDAGPPSEHSAGHQRDSSARETLRGLLLITAILAVALGFWLAIYLIVRAALG